jgi:hypothetical protein
MRYACRHGYTLLFYLLRTPGCVHPLWGTRHPSYCKLTAIGEALAAGYEWVVYLDSDAFVRASDDLPSLLSKYGAPADAARRRGAHRGGPSSAVEPEAFFGWDHPFTLGPNMGFIALRNTPSVRAMLRVWWNGYAAAFSTEHPFEQHTLQWHVMHLDRFRSRVQTLSLRTMDDTYPDDVVHLVRSAPRPRPRPRLATTLRVTAGAVCINGGGCGPVGGSGPGGGACTAAGCACPLGAHTRAQRSHTCAALTRRPHAAHTLWASGRTTTLARRHGSG